MADPKQSVRIRPMNVAVAKGSKAEKAFRAKAASFELALQPEVIAPGVKPTPKHNLIFHGGKTIQQLTFTNLFVGGNQAWQASDIQNIDKALAAAMSDQQLNNVIVQYFSNQPITSTFKPSQILPGSKPVVFSQGDVEKLVNQLHAQGTLAGFNLGSTVFNFMLPAGTVLTTDANPTNTATTRPVKSVASRNPVHPEEEDSSLEGLGGYHGSVHVSAQDTVYYAVGVFSQNLPDGSENGIVAFDKPWKNVVATFYHELNEARTDADVEDAIKAGNDPKAVKFLGWVSRQGEECGDFPMSEVGSALNLIMKEVPLTDGSSKVPVQFQYSNAVSGPEGPIPAPHPLPKH